MAAASTAWALDTARAHRRLIGRSPRSRLFLRSAAAVTLPHEGSARALLERVLPQVDAGVLPRWVGERVRADVDAAFGADVVDEGRRIWRQVLALRDNDDDLLLSLADRWCRLLPAQDPHDVDGRGDGGGDGAVVLDPSGEPASTWSFVTTSHPSWSTVVPCKSARPFAIAVKSCRSAFTVCADGFAVLRCTRNSSNREASRSSSMAPILPGAATFTALPPGVDRPCRAAWNLRLLEAAAPRWTPPTCAACGC
jgi:hypothetical protein